MAKVELDLGRCKVRWFEQDLDEDVWSGSVYFFGYPHHFMAIKVKVGPDGSWKGTKDPHDRLQDYYTMYPFPPMPAQIPGLDGDYVILIHPHGN